MCLSGAEAAEETAEAANARRQQAKGKGPAGRRGAADAASSEPTMAPPSAGRRAKGDSI